MNSIQTLRDSARRACPAVRIAVSSVMIGLACSAMAQPTPPPPPAAPASTVAKDETVQLAQFTINESPDNPYLSKQALSGTRVAMSIQDIPQTVSIVTSAFIQDSMSQRMLDAAKYVTPVVESTLPVGGDRYTIRGFQVSHEFLDGMVISGEDGYSMSIAPYNIDRIEIIKGPNAILVPGGAPGGQFNPITKSPFMKDESSATLEVAQFFGTAVSTDVNRVISSSKGVAVRLVAALWRSDGYQRNSFRRGFEIAPSISWQISPANKLVVKAEFVHNNEIAGIGEPLDLAVGSDDYARVARGLPRDWSFGSAMDHRLRKTERVTAELFSTLSEHITSHLLISGDSILREDQGGTSAAIFAPDPVTGKLVAFNPTRNPFTGKYEPGVTWAVSYPGTNAVATSTVTPVPDPSTWVYHRVNGSDHLYYNEAHLRDDFAGKFDTDYVNSTTIAGVAANYSKTKWKSFVGQPQGPDVTNATLDSITYTPYIFPEPSPALGVQNKTAKLREVQLYIYETASFFKDRVLFAGGLSRYFGTLSRVDTTGVGPRGAVSDLKIKTTAKSYGLTVKPIKEVALYYSHNSSGESMPGSLQAGNPAIQPGLNPPFKPTNGTQDEFGVKTSFLQDRLTLSLAHFNISQTNYAVPNSEYYTLVAQGNQTAANALPTSTYLDVNSKGWEAEGSFALSRNLTIIGNVSDYKYRQPTGVRIRAVPDHIAALYLDYRLTEGALKGFGVNAGVDSHSDAVGESVTGLTTTKPLSGTIPTYPGVAAGFVPLQATYKIQGRTLVNVGLTYRAKEWTARLQVSNALDKDYVYAGGSRTSIVAGDPRNFRGSVTYKF